MHAVQVWSTLTVVVEPTYPQNGWGYCGHKRYWDWGLKFKFGKTKDLPIHWNSGKVWLGMINLILWQYSNGVIIALVDEND